MLLKEPAFECKLHLQVLHSLTGMQCKSRGLDTGVHCHRQQLITAFQGEDDGGLCDAYAMRSPQPFLQLSLREGRTTALLLAQGDAHPFREVSCGAVVFARGVIREGS
ncbi:unnamed protein product [Sphagnum jensenii]|uniref:Uncharacterized protein n=1 Tax=Sphagnum jensenii TaxID=128206 RepID=A0ABP1B5Q1_9BRYO